MMKVLNNKTSIATRFLYRTFLGRLVLKILTMPIISKIGGIFMNSFVSKLLIKPFVKKHHINLDLYEKNKFKNYNDFFTRKLKAENISIDINSNSFIAPCDAKLQIFSINNNNSFQIKNSLYSVSSLLENDAIYKDYQDGLLCIFRLTVDDYHRYIYIDNGRKQKNIFIKGKLHTVQPIALEKYNIYKTNSREYTVLNTENFNDIIQVEVGALMVGKIKNHHQEHNFKRGEEKGMFLFGGSTICLLIKKDTVKFDSEILQNSKENYETFVKIGQKIGEKI